MILALISQTLLIILLLTFSFGPAFFALINTGIKNGYRTGSMLAIGVVASDTVLCMLIIILVNMGATNYLHNQRAQLFMGIAAGVILIIFGVLYLRKPVTTSEETIEIKAPNAGLMVLKGFFLNCLNPGVWILWLGNVTAVSETFSFSNQKMIMYFGIILALVLLVELGKLSIANRLKHILTGKIMSTINMVTGYLLIGFGIYLIYKHYFHQS